MACIILLLLGAFSWDFGLGRQMQRPEEKGRELYIMNRSIKELCSAASSWATTDQLATNNQHSSVQFSLTSKWSSSHLIRAPLLGHHQRYYYYYRDWLIVPITANCLWWSEEGLLLCLCSYIVSLTDLMWLISSDCHCHPGLNWDRKASNCKNTIIGNYIHPYRISLIAN